MLLYGDDSSRPADRRTARQILVHRLIFVENMTFQGLLDVAGRSN